MIKELSEHRSEVISEKGPITNTEIRLSDAVNPKKVVKPLISPPKTFVTGELKPAKPQEDAKWSNFSSDDRVVRESIQNNAKASRQIMSGRDNKQGDREDQARNKETPQFMSNFHETPVQRLDKPAKQELAQNYIESEDEIVYRQLEAEKARLQEQLKLANARNQQLKKLSKSSKSKPDASFPTERLEDFENQLKTLRLVMQQKREKTSQLKDILKKNIIKKHEGLVELENLKQKIVKMKDGTAKLAEELDLRKAELLTETLSYNSQLEKTLNTPEDFRLLRYFKESSDNLSKRDSLEIKRGYCAEPVALIEENLPRGFITDMEDENILKLKFLTAKKKGIFFEDDSLKIAVKQVVKEDKVSGFVLRFISKRDHEEWVDVSFAGNHRGFKFSVDKRVFEIEPSDFYDLELDIIKKPEREMPHMQVKTKKGEEQELLITNISIPIAINWYYPHIKLAKSQYNYLWNSSKGYLVQSEMREVDRALFAGEAELLAFIDNLRLFEISKSSLPR